MLNPTPMDVDEHSNVQASSSRAHNPPALTKDYKVDLDFDDVDEDVFHAAGNLESDFYTAGYRSGFDHGKLHGLFEGRQLGQEKAWEIWEEVGYYEGFATFWIKALERGMSKGIKSSRKDAKAVNNGIILLGLIEEFPTFNPTPTSAPIATTSEPMLTKGHDNGSDTTPRSTLIPAATSNTENETDLAGLLSQIRARYRLLCSSLGTRPRLIAMSHDIDTGRVNSAVVEGIEGPMKGVDTRQLRF